MDERCWCGILDQYDGSERHYEIGGGWVDCAEVVRAYVGQTKADPLSWGPEYPDAGARDMAGYLDTMTAITTRLLAEVERLRIACCLTSHQTTLNTTTIRCGEHGWSIRSLGEGAWEISGDAPFRLQRLDGR